MNLQTFRASVIVLCSFVCASAPGAFGQTAERPTIEEQVKQLSVAVSQTQAKLEESQRELTDMRKQLALLQTQLVTAQAQPFPPSSSGVDKSQDDIAERVDMQQSQIATQEQTKVETTSKFPFRVTGLLLMDGFVNTSGVDWAATPTIAESGSGTTGLSVRQTILGFEAQGPHLWNASSYADLNVDFSGTPAASSNNYSGFYYGHPSAVRLRTMHAGLRWQRSTLEFAFDRPILSPDAPSTLTALSEPEFAWSGNLWQWNPQLSVSRTLPVGKQAGLQLQAAWIDPQDAILPPLSTSQYVSHSLYNSLSEQSRWPGLEGRIALLRHQASGRSSHLGIGGYISRHADPNGESFNAWAATMDAQLQLPKGFELTGNFYRGAALGGLGAGAYKDFVYRTSTGSATGYDYDPLDDVGGWAQLKKRAGQKLEFNGAFGIDNAFTHELREYSFPNPTVYQALARNRTALANVIFSPRTYLLFSAEYRHLMSSPYTGQTHSSNIIGLSAGYKF